MAWCMRTISLFFNIFSARCVPVGLCLTSFTRPNPPVPVSTIKLVRGTHDVRRAGGQKRRHVPLVLRISRSSRLACAEFSRVGSTRTSDGRAGRGVPTRSWENMPLSVLVTPAPPLSASFPAISGRRIRLSPLGQPPVLVRSRSQVHTSDTTVAATVARGPNVVPSWSIMLRIWWLSDSVVLRPKIVLFISRLEGQISGLAENPSNIVVTPAAAERRVGAPVAAQTRRRRPVWGA
jgi:hypothetical protein